MQWVYIKRRNWKKINSDYDKRMRCRYGITFSKVRVAYRSQKRALLSMLDEIKLIAATGLLSDESAREAKELLRKDSGLVSEYWFTLKDNTAVWAEVEKMQVF